MVAVFDFFSTNEFKNWYTACSGLSAGSGSSYWLQQLEMRMPNALVPNAAASAVDLCD
jgi:hypothetical protein